MLTPRLLRWMFRLSLTGFVFVLAIQVGLTVMIARPGLFYSHAVGNGAITFHAQTAVPPEARRMADTVLAALIQGPMGAPEAPVDVWLVEGGLPLRLFFAGSPNASGLTYPVASTRNVFLRHADFARNRLVREAWTVPPPRTLSYYLIHEITHLQVARTIGRRRIVRMPRWINEGFADYVALGPADPAMIGAVRDGLVLPRQNFGTYPRERVCVTLALAQLPDPAQLFALDVDLPEARGCPPVPEFGVALSGPRP